VRTLANAQASRGDEVHVVCLAHDATVPRQGWDHEVFVRRFAPRVRFAKLEWTPEITGYLEDLHCDILHIHLPNPSMTLAAIGLCTRVPIVATFHSDVVGMALRRWLFAPCERRLLQRLHFVVATNPRMAAASECLAKHAARVRVIPLGIALEPFMTRSAALEQKCDQIRAALAGPIWLMCGRLVPYKGHSTALRALVKTAGTLVVIGDGPLRGELRRQAARLGIENRVRFLGHVPNDDDVIAYYRAATALWLPSILPSEAFGLVQVEAMASGCPVINTDIPGSGVPWVSRHLETGLTVPVGDAEALANAASRLYTDPELRARLAQNGPIRAAAEFNQEVMAERWQDLYDAVLSGREHENADHSLGVSVALN